MRFITKSGVFLFLMFAGFFTGPLWGQHHHMHHEVVDSSYAAQADHRMPMQQNYGHEDHAHQAHQMASILSDFAPMGRDGSGTSWHPDVTPMEGWHKNADKWQFMLHGRSFLRYTHQDIFNAGYRGAKTFGAPTWIMGMGVRPLSERSRLSARIMLTGEPLTEGGDGYPLLFQTGETYEGTPLVDWQHPHDLFAELSLTYSHTFSERVGYFVYLAYPGEPAIGPPAFMHRPSAQHIPNSPIGHHWQDATHVTFGVATAGFIYGPLKLDGSVFTGREPDEERLGFDEPRFDSYSGRVSLNLGTNWAMQVSRAYIRGPEVHAPDIDMWRTAVSVLYGRTGVQADFAASFVWGMNDPAGNANNDSHTHITGRNGEHLHAHTVTQQSFLLEGDIRYRKHVFFSRLEFLQKDGAELGVADLQDELFWIGSASLGGAHVVLDEDAFSVLAGIKATTYHVPGSLQFYYGLRPLSGQIYLRLQLK